MPTYPFENAAKMCEVGLGKILHGGWRIIAHVASR
jgi:hypothetical protein